MYCASNQSQPVEGEGVDRCIFLYIYSDVFLQPPPLHPQMSKSLQYCGLPEERGVEQAVPEPEPAAPGGVSGLSSQRSLPGKETKFLRSLDLRVLKSALLMRHSAKFLLFFPQLFIIN
jgi:hypothetical protein